MSAKGQDGKLFARGKTAELRAELAQSNKRDKNHSAKKIALKRVVANMTMSNNDMVTLFPDIIACMGIHSIEIKKMCFLYLVNYSRQRPDEAVNALPILLRDIEDSNPLIRALALRTMAYINVEKFVVKTLPCIKHLIRDLDPYVRKTAAFAVAKAYEHNRAKVESTGVIESLNGMLQDENPTVVSSALAALMDIWERNDSIKLTIDYSNASKIIQILPDCSEWGQTYILEALTNYVPHDCTEATILAERIAPRLSHSNSAVVLTSIRVILYFMNYISDTKTITSLCQKLSPPLVTLLSKGPEIQYLALRNALLILQRRPEVLCNDIRVFFCKYNDPIYVKVTKLELIFLLANEKNIKEVLAELREYATEIDVDFVRKSVRVIGKLAIKIESTAKKCISTLLELVDTKVSYIVQEATVVIRNIFRKYPNQYESIISRLCENLDDLDEPEAKAAMIWVVGQYADRIENADELLDDFLFTFADETIEVQLALLTATVKLFLHRPTKGQELVPKVLKWATEETDNPDLRDRGYMYWRLLLRDHGQAKLIVLGEKPPITAESELVEPKTLDELCLVIGSLATIYLKPIQQVFRSARVRKLGESPALQRRNTPTPQSALASKLERGRLSSNSPTVPDLLSPGTINSLPPANVQVPFPTGFNGSMMAVPHPALAIDPGRSASMFPASMNYSGHTYLAPPGSVYSSSPHTAISPAGHPSLTGDMSNGGAFMTFSPDTSAMSPLSGVSSANPWSVGQSPLPQTQPNQLRISPGHGPGQMEALQRQFQGQYLSVNTVTSTNAGPQSATMMLQQNQNGTPLTKMQTGMQLTPSTSAQYLATPSSSQANLQNQGVHPDLDDLLL